MLEKYYKRPVLYDYIISVGIVCVLFFLVEYNVFRVPIACDNLDLATDIGGIGLTISGFILTLITILMTLRSGQILSEEELRNNSSPFKVFLSSDLYLKSIKILKNGVLSLIIICFIIFFFKLLFSASLGKYFFYFNIVGLIIIITTFSRCFYVLNLIMKMQSK